MVSALNAQSTSGASVVMSGRFDAAEADVRSRVLRPRPSPGQSQCGLRNDWQTDETGCPRRVIDPLRSLHVVLRLCEEDVGDEGLRIPIVERKLPGRTCQDVMFQEWRSVSTVLSERSRWAWRWARCQAGKADPSMVAPLAVSRRICARPDRRASIQPRVTMRATLRDNVDFSMSRIAHRAFGWASDASATATSTPSCAALTPCGRRAASYRRVTLRCRRRTRIARHCFAMIRAASMAAAFADSRPPRGTAC